MLFPWSNREHLQPATQQTDSAISKQHKGTIMERLTSELAAQQVGSKYDLILIAARRARELKNGYAPHVDNRGHGEVVTALLEIEQGHVGRDYLLKPPELKPNTRNSHR